MDKVFWAKRWDHITSRWPSANQGPDLFLSLFSRNGKGCWVGGWFGGQREVVSNQPKSTPGTPKQPTEALETTFQSSKTIRGLPKGVWPTFEKIQNLADSNGVVGGSVVIDQLLQSGSKLNFPRYYMDRGFWAKRWAHITQKRQSGSVGPELFLSLFQKSGKGCWMVRWSKVNFLAALRDLKPESLYG